MADLSVNIAGVELRVQSDSDMNMGNCIRCLFLAAFHAKVQR